MRATAELSVLRELHTEVLREKRTVERHAASTDELRETVVVRRYA